jgi:hypothetical protein
MKALKIGSIAFLICLISASLAHAQDRFQVSCNFALGFPQAEFKQNAERLGVGGSGLFTYRIAKSPISVGTSFSIMVYGTESRSESFSDTIQDVWVNVRTRNYLLTGYFLLRIQPREGALRPYVDGMIGFNHLWTETGVYDPEWIEYNKIASNVQISDWALSGGFGGGIMFQLFGWQQKSLSRLYLDVGIRYLKGGEALYMTRNSRHYDGNDIYYTYDRSATDMITSYIGFVFSF